MMGRLFLIILLLILQSCSQKSGEISNAKILIKNSFAITTSNPGGMMLYMHNTTTGKVKAVSITDPSYDVTLENGTWILSIIGWQGATPFSGNLVCGTTTASVKGIDLDISLAVNSANCNSNAFSHVNHRAGNLTNTVNLVNCFNFTSVTAAGTNCDGANKGLSGSYKIHLLQYEDAPPSALPAVLSGIQSDCLVATGGAVSFNNTNFKIPTGHTGEKLSAVIESFTDSACTSGKQSFLFANGLGSPSDPTLAKVYPNGSNTDIYILHGGATANIIYSSGSTAFGVAVQGATPSAITYTFTNNGGTTAYLSAITGLSTYTLSSNTCGSGSIAPSGTCSVTVTLPTTTAGTYNHNLTINYNSSTTVLPITGSVITPANLSISDGPTYDFGYVNVGSSPTKTFTITNSGAATASSINFTGAAGPLTLTGGTCAATLSGGSTCTQIVTYSPSTYGLNTINLTANYNDGVGAASPVIRAVQGKGVVVATVGANWPTNGANWNDYVVHTAATAWQNVSDTVCNTTSSVACLHGGEIRKVSLNSFNGNLCTNLTFSDSLGVFDWECFPGNPVVFRSKGFKKGKGLRDLVSATAWNNNQFSVYLSGDLVAQSTSAAWWTNPIIQLSGSVTSSSYGAALPLSGTGYMGKSVTGTTGSGTLITWDLTTANAVYTIPSNMTTVALHLGANKISVVTLGSSVLSTSNTSSNTCAAASGAITSADTPVLICGGATAGRDHTWVEVNASGPTGGGAIIYSYDSRFSRIHRSDIHNGVMGIKWSGVTKTNTISDTIIHHNSSDGFYCYSSELNILRDVISHTNTGTGFNLYYVTVTTNSNVIINSKAMNNGSHGFMLDATAVNMQNILASGNGGNGIHLNAVNGYPNLSNITSTNNAGYGITLDTTIGAYVVNGTFANNGNSGLRINAGSAHHIFNVVTANNSATGAGIELLGSTTGNIFKGLASAHNYKNITITTSNTNTFDIVLTGNASNIDCTRSGGAGNLINGGAFPVSGSCAGTATSIDISSTNTFLGVVTSDTQNADNGAISTGVIAGASITDFTNFMNPFRYWGKDHTLSPYNNPLYTSTKGRCVSGGNCSLWDWRLKSGDATLLNKTGNGLSSNGTFTPAVACPASVSGSQSLLDGTYVMLHASEILDKMDGVGDDDGLCESNEVCTYAPNFGAFQGEGTLTNSCTFTPGSVTGVTMKAFPQPYGT